MTTPSPLIIDFHDSDHRHECDVMDCHRDSTMTHYVGRRAVRVDVCDEHHEAILDGASINT